MADAHIATAFTFGLLATVNPCALPMLPAYLGWFIVGDDERRTPEARVTRAVVVALCITFGFVAVFGALGAVTNAASNKAQEITPWATPVVGLLLAVVGIWLLLGRKLTLPTPALSAGGGKRGLAAMVVYGVSYAVVSVSCSLPVFLGYASTSAGVSWSTALTNLVAFAFGFGLVLVALSVSVALLRGSIAAGARRASEYAGRVAGGLLVASGLYLCWYGVQAVQRSPDHDPVIGRVTGWSEDISARVHSIGGVEIGLVLALFLAVVTMAVLLHNPGGSASRPRRRSPG